MKSFIHSKTPEESLIPLGTLVMYTGALYDTPVYDASMAKTIGSIKFNGVALIIGQSYDDRYINVLTADGINGWVLCYQLTVVN
jgi:hypothetical protein